MTTHFSAPVVAYALATGSGGSDPEQGPSLFFQGQGFGDPQTPYAPGVTGLGKLYGFYQSPMVTLLDMVPATISAVSIAAAQTVTAATPMTLVTTAAYGLSPKMKIVPAGSARIAASQVSVTGLDMGLGSCTITAGSKSFSSFLTFGIGGTAVLHVGMPVFVAGAGASGFPLFTRVATITSATAGTFEDAAGTSVTAQAIGSADASLVTPEPYVRVGALRLFDPFQGCCRSVAIAAAGGAANQAITVNGYDIYLRPMSEAITTVAGTTVSGKKAFKFVTSVVPASTDATASAYSVGVGDVLGFNLRVDRFEYTNIFQAGALITAGTGWLTADITSPATTTTGDVRGTYALQTASNGTAVATGRRTTLRAMMPAYTMGKATPADLVPLFGVSQV